MLALAAEHGIPRRPPIDIASIVERLGINVDYVNEPGDLVGQITKYQGSCNIVINQHNNWYEPRLRFTLAHEIGHFILHLNKHEDGEFKDTPITMSRTSSYWDRTEAEANSFAAELLMPSDLIFQEANYIISEYKQSHNAQISKDEFKDRMSRAFNVSFAAMEYRLSNLGIF
nr:ImmA/IrrE family metallo-endopeptidase [Stenotrophomonas sp. JAI102]